MPARSGPIASPTDVVAGPGCSAYASVTTGDASRSAAAARRSASAAARSPCCTARRRGSDRCWPIAEDTLEPASRRRPPAQYRERRARRSSRPRSDAPTDAAEADVERVGYRRARLPLYARSAATCDALAAPPLPPSGMIRDAARYRATACCLARRGRERSGRDVGVAGPWSVDFEQAARREGAGGDCHDRAVRARESVVPKFEGPLRQGVPRGRG